MVSGEIRQGIEVEGLQLCFVDSFDSGRNCTACAMKDGNSRGTELARLQMFSLNWNEAV